MGGSTVSRTGLDVDKLLATMKSEIANGMQMRIYPDSRLILLKPLDGTTRTFKVEVDPEAGTVKFDEDTRESTIEQRGDRIAIAVAAKYGKKPKTDEWIAIVHLHT